jgi:hypothetical protein
VRVACALTSSIQPPFGYGFWTMWCASIFPPLCLPVQCPFMPALSKLLREHKLASPFSRPVDSVFASERGTGMRYRNVTRSGLDKALDGAGLEKIRFHDLRHTSPAS